MSEPIGSRRKAVVIRGDSLTIGDVVGVARDGTEVELTDDREVLGRVDASHEYILRAIESCQPVENLIPSTCRPIYGVTTGFGGMATAFIPPAMAAALQQNLIVYHKAGAGERIGLADVRAAMLIRANSHLLGLSGLRMELIERMVTFLNAGVTPHVREFGSIGASGDLTPLAAITGALIGLDKSFTVDFDGEEVDSLTALARLGLAPLELLPKEGLAMINGTCVMTGVAALCIHDARLLLDLTFAAHALFIQGLAGSNQPFHPFIHRSKPHPGQIWAAESILNLLRGSTLVRDELEGRLEYETGKLIQDRYSVRCLPQYMGPIVDGFDVVERQVTTEMNSASDNPLIDPDREMNYHGGNFLGQYIGVVMDQLRYYLGLAAKHLDAQIALLNTPEFSNGLPPCLIGNRERTVNMGLKALQICGNSIMPMIVFLGQSLVDRFPTHAEQFNQNVNSLGLGSARLARQSIDAFQQYMAVALMFGVQAVDLRTYLAAGHYDARPHLSPVSRQVYEAVKEIVGRPPSGTRPYIRDDNEQWIDEHIALLADDVRRGTRLATAVRSAGDAPS
jgi:phenylalanine ammonia-lyase